MEKLEKTFSLKYSLPGTHMLSNHTLLSKFSFCVIEYSLYIFIEEGMTSTKHCKLLYKTVKKKVGSGTRIKRNYVSCVIITDMNMDLCLMRQGAAGND